jgi:acyl-CoA thioesterase YciA
MAQVDLAGAVLPVRVARGRIATVAVNQFIFKQPVSVGDLLSFYARIARIGTHVGHGACRGLGRAQPGRAPQVVKVTEANLTYVAIDGQGSLAPPRWPWHWPA